MSGENGGPFCPFSICLMLIRIAGGVIAALMFDVKYMFALIPIAFLMNYFTLCIVGDKKVAQSKTGLIYYKLSCAYTAIFIFGIAEWKKEQCYRGWFLNWGSIYVALTMNFVIDLYVNRKYFIKLGRKFCLSNELKMEFKRIKACKKQMKYA